MRTESTTMRLMMKLARLLLLLYFVDLSCAACSNTNLFTCDDNTCISRIKACDGKSDCPNGEDESYTRANCTGEPYCKKRNRRIASLNGYHCNKKCDPRMPRTCRRHLSQCICDDECGFSCVNQDLSCPIIVPIVRNSVGHSVIRFDGNSKVTVPNGNPYKYGDMLKYNCQAGTFLVGQLPRCTSKGHWSKRLPQCKADFCRLTPCLNGGTCVNRRYKRVCFCNRLYTGDKCHIAKRTPCTRNPCRNGGHCIPYRQRFTCKCPQPFDGNLCETDRRFEERTLCARNPCKNGGNCISLGQTYTCKCPKNFTGDRCETELFCVGPPIPERGYVEEEKDRWFVDEIVTLHCLEGYLLVGKKTRLCMKNGTWSSGDTKCVRNVCLLDQYLLPENLEVPGYTPLQLYNEKFSVGDAIALSCASGFKLFLNDSLFYPPDIRCDYEGKWIPSYLDIYCEAVVETVCTDPVIPKHIFITSSKDVPQYSVGTVLNVHCELLYKLSGPDSITCQGDGTWSAFPGCNLITVTESPPPEIFCGEPSASEQMLVSKRGDQSLFNSGERIELQCKLGYKLVGPSSIVCQPDGSWTKLPACVQSGCSDPTERFAQQIRVDQNIRKKFYDTNELIHFSCHNTDEYVLSQVSEKLVNSTACTSSGNWDPAPESLDCVHVCRPPPLVEKGKMLLNSQVQIFYPNDTIFLDCPPNYRHSGHNEVRCLSDGSWTEMTPCEPIGCVIDVESIHNSVIIKGYASESLPEVEFAVGETISILCANEDKVLSKNLTGTITCEVGNSWSSSYAEYQCNNLTCTNRCLSKDGPCGCDFECKTRNDCCSDFDTICTK